jgi:hypothetical protein
VLTTTPSVLSLFLAPIQLTEAIAQIGFTQDSNGMPLTATIQYTSDFGEALNLNTADKAWLETNVAIGGTGSGFYTGTPSVVVNSATVFTVTLPRIGGVPTVGDYTVVLTVQLNYNNEGTNVKMDEVVYTFDVNVAGTASSAVVISASGATTVGGFTAGTITDETIGNGNVVSATPTLALAQSGSNIAFGADLVVQATVVGTTHTIWVDSAEAITVDSLDSVDSANKYEWPNAAASSSQASELTGVHLVTVTLKSVPVEVFNWATAYVKLTIHFRDESNDYPGRALRRLQDDASTKELTGLQEGIAELVAEVTFVTDESGSVTATFMILSTTVIAGAALLL